MDRSSPDNVDAAAMIAFEYAPQGLIYSSRRIVGRANGSFAAMFGLDPSCVSGTPLLGLYQSKSEFEKIGATAYAALKDTGSYEDERIMIRRNGEPFRCRVSGRSLTPEDPFESSVWSFVDISSKWEFRDLTPRSREIVLMLSQGRSAKEVALQLDLSPRTVETYLARIRTKLGVKNSAELMSRVIGALS